ncbi:MAG TPA: hypothetical protein DCS93_36800 [Microscillaceae bacterium]|nr:hypothetical protein [Microscillaceae bacterium]
MKAQHINQIFLIIITWLLAGCVSSWQPAPSVSNATTVVRVTSSFPNSLVNALVFAEHPEKLDKLIIPTIKPHPTEGPFIFEGKNMVVVVAKNKPSGFVQAQICGFAAKALIRYYPLNYDRTTQKVTLSKKYQDFAPCKPAMVNRRRKIKLMPKQIASALAKFGHWDGVSLDTANQKLSFIGSNVKQSPKISTSDLIAAYNAIFVHEAAGEPLFVDMDFSDNDKDYTVTFGGGFEDTRPGRVLLAADVLLKAISSGIDPWTNVKPLSDDMCMSPQNAIQRLYCKYIKGVNKNNLKRIMNAISGSFQQKGERVTTMLMSAHAEDSRACIEWIFRANYKEQQRILREVEANGYFTYLPFNDFKTLLENQDSDLWNRLDKEKLKELYNRSFDEIASNSQFRVRSCAINGGKSEESKTAMLKRAKKIFSLSQQEKDIVLASYKNIENDVHRYIYTLLSVASPRMRYFLDTNVKFRNTIFGVYREMFRNEIKMEIYLSKYSSALDQEHRVNIKLLEGLFLLTHLLVSDSNFLNQIMALSEQDQLTFIYIATAALKDPGYVELIDKLQYHQPLCSTYDAGQSINNFSDAFKRFTCVQLSGFKRNYLANNIKAEAKQLGFKYETSNVLAAKKRSLRQRASGKTRFWFYPGNKVVTLNKGDYGTFLFNNPNMVAKAERLKGFGERRGPYEAVDLMEDRIPGIHENLDNLNANYEKFAEIFPTLKELNNLVKLLAFFRWIRDIKPDQFDLSAFETAFDAGTPTLRKYPLYETVIAMPDGSFITAVGGVDLHSKTQIEMKNLEVLKKQVSQGGGEISFQGKTYETVAINTLNGLNDFHETRVISQANQSVLTNQVDETQVISSLYKQKSGLFRIRNKENAFNERELTLTQLTQKDHYQHMVLINDSLAQGWQIMRTGEKVVASRQTSTTEKITKAFFKTWVQYAVTQNLPIKSMGEVLKTLFGEVKVIKQNGKYLIKFNHDQKEYTYLAGIRTNSGRFFIEQVDSSATLETGYPVNQKDIFQLSFHSTLSTDSLYVTDLGVIKGLEFSLQIFNQGKLLESKLITDGKLDKPIPFVLNAKGVPVFQFKQQQVYQAKYGSYELLNRPSLVRATAFWQRKRLEQGKKSLLIHASSQANSLRKTTSLKAPQKRLYVFDQSGFLPYQQQWIQSVKQQNPNQAIIFTEKPTEARNLEAEELIWITTLPESLLMNRLQALSKKGVFKSVKRLRVWNVNNPVLNLGQGLFVENPQLQMVGAWSHIVDFSALQPFLEQMMKVPTKELNQQMLQVVRSLRANYQQNPSPVFRLRVARYLPELLQFWEEVGSNDQQWVIQKYK